MGCTGSKAAEPVSSPKTNGAMPSTTAPQKARSFARRGKDEVYKLLASAVEMDVLTEVWAKVKQYVERDPRNAMYIHPTSKRTPLHLACSLVDLEDGDGGKTAFAAIQSIMQACSENVSSTDTAGNIPLHFVLSPATESSKPPRYNARGRVLNALLAVDEKACKDYLRRNDVMFDKETGGVSPLYHALQMLPDDFDPKGTTVTYVTLVHGVARNMVPIGNASDGDRPLALLYRRFTRQFDLSEKFFPGDNSRPEVVEHRRRYKIAASNTWKIIELMLKPAADQWRVVHRAIQVETPPDLLRYIVETNAEELTEADSEGNLPLHYAAKSLPSQSSFPPYYTKYVVDELLYKFPEAAAIQDAQGRFPLSLAVQTGKQWIGGGVKSLYEAHPEALHQIDLDAHSSLKKVLSFEDDAVKASQDKNGGDAVPFGKGIVRDEHHDAIMLVQQNNVSISEVVSAMWAHEEDAGVQMLGCVAVSRLADACDTKVGKLRLALSSVAAVVNAMKAHPNEPVVQEKACSALKKLACADGDREVSFVASGAIAAVVGAMQAHVGDPAIQMEACGAIADIVDRGGAERATVVASVSGLTAIINALSAHPDNEDVQKEACRALKNVSDYPNANVPELPRSQLEQLLEAAKESFVECEEDADILLSRLS